MAFRLVLASHNQHKIREIKELTAHLGFPVLGLGEVGDLPPVEEDGETFHANARKKAVETARKLGEWVLADDSGLEVDALGAPQACTRPALPGKVGEMPATTSCS